MKIICFLKIHFVVSICCIIYSDNPIIVSSFFDYS